MFTHKLTVQPSDVSSQGTIKLRALLDYFQDTAGIAVESVEGTTTELIARGYAWVLTRYELEFTGRLPSLDEHFRITTFHDPSHGYNTLRVFQVNSDDGTPIAWAKTSWLLLDLAAGRPVKPSSHLPEIFDSPDKETISPDFREIPEMNDHIIHSTVIPVKWHDLDYNAHVNNAVYFEWIYDNSPVDLNAFEIKSIYASFRSGAKFGENITMNIAEAEPDTYTYNYRIIRENVKKPCAEFMCVWERI